MVIRADGASAIIDNDGFAHALSTAWSEANWQSPVPGPLDIVTTWAIIARLVWGLVTRLDSVFAACVLSTVGEVQKVFDKALGIEF